MKICAVIAEFSPFHNGHKYLLNEAKRISGCDAVLCVMSGDFVQRAEPSIVSKNLRTEFALMNGADLVIELPVLYSAANAQMFAFGAVNIISQLTMVTALCFGAENSDIEILKTIAEIQFTESSQFKFALKELLSSGISYPTALAKATSIIAENYGIMSDNILRKPNNLLAIEYIKQLMSINSKLDIFAVKRIGSDYNDKVLKDDYSSATSIRENILTKNFDKAIKNLPFNCREKFINEIETHLPNNEVFNALVSYSIRNNDNLKNLYDAGEGLEIKLQKNSFMYFDLETILEKTKSKRYSMSRIKRLCLQSLLNINKNSLINNVDIPLKILGVKNEFKSLLSMLPENSIIKNKDYEKSSVLAFENYINIEKKASIIYSQITKKPGDTFYSNKLIIV